MELNTQYVIMLIGTNLKCRLISESRNDRFGKATNPAQHISQITGNDSSWEPPDGLTLQVRFCEGWFAGILAAILPFDVSSEINRVVFEAC
jgi:hypothetical protein